MSYRDDLDATVARIDVLERELLSLISENSKLRGKRSPYALPPRRLRVKTNLEAAGAHVDVLSREKARLFEENERIRAGGAPPAVNEHKPWPLHDEGPVMTTDGGNTLTPLGAIFVIAIFILAAIARAVA